MQQLPALFVVWLLSGLMAARAGDCPPSCTCKWKGGKQTVECVNKGLITIPLGMDYGTQVLDLTGNNLDRLVRERFQRVGLINLQKIFLPRCRIRHIEDRAFKGLTNLVELDLSDNYITSVPSVTFNDYPSLMRLTLNSNPIRIIKAAAFQPLSFLTTLELSKCDLERIEKGSFEGLSSIEWLKLDNNKLRWIPGVTTLPRTLHGVDLQHNPWNCDCRLRDLRAWLIKFVVPTTIEPVCASPSRFRDFQVKTMKETQLACMPEVKRAPLTLEIAEGQNVSLLCEVSAVPEAKISWSREGSLLQNDSTVAPGLHLYYFVEEGTVDKTSELFIFNANVDDNGTFACVAENPAGRSHSNYTIRVILKEEPLTGLAVFPYEYFVVVSAAVSVISILGIICVTLCVIQCKRQRRRRRKKDRGKGVTLLHSQPMAKSSEMGEPITRLNSGHPAMKANGTLLNQDSMSLTTGPGVLVIPNNLAYTSPPTASLGLNLASLPPEQNPDLISDTATSGGLVKDWRDVTDCGTLPRRDLFPKRLAADVHLSPGKFIDPEGYPMDYGLPRLAGVVVGVGGGGGGVGMGMGGGGVGMGMGGGYYRTLPHKPRNVIAAPRFAREAELPGPYCPTGDMRYTAEGYPSAQQAVFFHQDPFISPPAPYKSDPKDAAAQWPESDLDSIATPSIINQRPTASVGAQAGGGGESLVVNGEIGVVGVAGGGCGGGGGGGGGGVRVEDGDQSVSPPTESPDEGYVGESVDSRSLNSPRLVDA